MKSKVVSSILDLEPAVKSQTNTTHNTLRGFWIKIEKASNDAFAGLKWVLQGFSIYFLWNPRIKTWNLSARQPNQFSQNQLSCPSHGFHALNSSISFKIYSKPLSRALWFSEGLVDDFCNFIQNLLSALCYLE